MGASSYYDEAANTGGALQRRSFRKGRGIVRRAAGFLLAVSILSGCASMGTAAMGADSADALAGKSPALSKRTQEDFSAATPGTAAFGLIGAVAMINQYRQSSRG